MLPVSTMLLILFFHWFADFVLQSEWQAKNKCINNFALFKHIFIYSFATIVLWSIFFNGNPKNFFLAFSLIFILHFLTDYITSRINAYFYKKNDIHRLFIIVGLDQWFHVVQLFLIFYFFLSRFNY